MPEVTFSFDGRNPEAARFARINSAQLVVEIDAETRKAIRALVTRGITQGIPPFDLARLLQPTIGLTTRQTIAVMKFREELINNGLTPSAVDRQINAYTNRLLQSRAENIARTEIIGSLSEGQQQAFEQAQEKGLLGAEAKKEWITTPLDACPICIDLDGKQVLLSGHFSSLVGPLDGPTAHPRCRCALAPVP